MVFLVLVDNLKKVYKIEEKSGKQGHVLKRNKFELFLQGAGNHTNVVKWIRWSLAENAKVVGTYWREIEENC